MICGVRARVEHATGKSRPKPWGRGAPMGCDFIRLLFPNLYFGFYVFSCSLIVAGFHRIHTRWPLRVLAVVCVNYRTSVPISTATSVGRTRTTRTSAARVTKNAGALWRPDWADFAFYCNVIRFDCFLLTTYNLARVYSSTLLAVLQSAHWH